jgi:4-hydroxy-tetrahydrodipicolinate synthase
MKKLYGTGVALITPFTESLEVDYKALKKLLQHTAKGADYYVVLGTTGESPTLTSEEKTKVLAFIKANNTAKLPIVYGIGGNNTHEVLEAIAETDYNGVDAILSVSPYYNKPSQEGIYQHYVKIADACPVPVILYNIPGRTGSNITAETTLRLANHKNIIGMKESSGNLEQCLKIAKHMPKDFLLVSGDDMLALSMYALGGKGLISVLANPYPTIFKKMKEYFLAGNTTKAAQELYKLSDLNGAMYEEGNPIGVKYVLAKLGLCGEHVRLPHAPASAGLRKRIDALLADVKK